MEMQAGFRDAIHVPFVMVRCDVDVSPGTKCSMRDNDESCVVWGGTPEDQEPMWHGVADPFLETDSIEAGTVFALYIRKECFYGLRHDFMLEMHDRGGTDTCHSMCNIF